MFWLSESIAEKLPVLGRTSQPRPGTIPGLKASPLVWFWSTHNQKTRDLPCLRILRNIHKGWR
jgi:hypothetical protein